MKPVKSAGLSKKNGGIKKMEEINEENKNIIGTQEESKKGSNWLDEEAKNTSSQGDFGEKLPSPTFEDSRITLINIDAVNPFNKWTDQETGKIKAIIPCTSDIEGKVVKCNWWCNLKNPIYKEIIHRCRDAPDKSSVLVKILQTGTKQNTKYTLIRE